MEYLFFFTLSLLIGSFLNVVILRGPKKAFSTENPRSFCPKCKNQLKWYHNIPILSWLFLKGKCSFCHEKISIQYPLIEFISALVLPICWYWFNGIEFIINSFILYTFIFLSLQDFNYKFVYLNQVLFLGILSIIPFFLHYEYWYYHLLFITFILILKFIFDYIKKETTLGEGDIIPLFSMSIFTFNYDNYLMELFLSLWIMSILVIIVAKVFKETRVPLIPYIFLAILFKSLLLLLI